VGGTDKSFSRQGESLTIYLKQLKETCLLNNPNCPIPIPRFRHNGLPYCKIAISYQGYRIVDEVYFENK
jgi:hypothetical protein